MSKNKSDIEKELAMYKNILANIQAELNMDPFIIDIPNRPYIEGVKDGWKAARKLIESLTEDRKLGLGHYEIKCNELEYQNKALRKTLDTIRNAVRAFSLKTSRGWNKCGACGEEKDNE